MTANTKGEEELDNARGTRTTQEEPDNTKGGKTTREGVGQCEEDGDNTRRGTTHTTAPAIQRDHHTNGRGTPHTRRGRQQHSRPSLTMPPTIRYATHPSAMAPPSTTVRGERTEDTPPHEHHRHTLTTHTPPTWQRTVHDTTAALMSTAAGWAGTGHTHWAGANQHSTPPPFHTPRRMDTIHSPTHPLSLIHVHTTDDQR